jgi:hypothetical protein
VAGGARARGEISSSGRGPGKRVPIRVGRESGSVPLRFALFGGRLELSRVSEILSATSAGVFGLHPSKCNLGSAKVKLGSLLLHVIITTIIEDDGNYSTPRSVLALTVNNQRFNTQKDGRSPVGRQGVMI